MFTKSISTHLPRFMASQPTKKIVVDTVVKISKSPETFINLRDWLVRLGYVYSPLIIYIFIIVIL